MPLPLIPLAAAAVITPIVWGLRKRRPPKGLTPERKKIFDAALLELKDSDKLRELSESFRKAGLKRESELLEKRAALRSLPVEQQKKRRAIFRKALKSRDKKAIMKVADAFRDEGATGAAATLRTYASGLES